VPAKKSSFQTANTVLPMLPASAGATAGKVIVCFFVLFYLLTPPPWGRERNWRKRQMSHLTPRKARREFSKSINVLIQGLAHEGALKNPEKFGQSNYKAAYGKIHWWLKRRWARLAVTTAIETPYCGLGYAGGSVQQQAAAFHAQAQAQGDWREDGAYRQREEETAAPFFGGFCGG
jgi:hypothetical protein